MLWSGEEESLARGDRLFQIEEKAQRCLHPDKNYKE